MPPWRARILAGEPILDGEGILGGERTLCGERNLCGKPIPDDDDGLDGERTLAGGRSLSGDGELACRYICSRLAAVRMRVRQNHASEQSVSLQCNSLMVQTYETTAVMRPWASASTRCNCCQRRNSTGIETQRLTCLAGC